MPNKSQIAIKKLKDSKIHYYWIINKKTDDIYGPLNWNEYLQKRKELGVPKKLKLEKKYKSTTGGGDDYSLLGNLFIHYQLGGKSI